MDIEKLYNLYLISNTISIDSRNISKNCLFFALQGENFDGNSFAEEACLKGALISIIDNKTYYNSTRNFIYVNNSLDTLQELAKFHRKKNSMIPLIAITGSNGKTTTKELITSVLSKKFITHATKDNFNNHIGVPLTLLSMPINTQIIILEMGANHRKEIEFLCTIAQPNYGYITNFGKAHIEGFGGFKGVILGKLELYKYIKLYGGKVFVNMDDPIQVKNSEKICRYGFSKKLYTDVFIQCLSHSFMMNLIFKKLKIYPQIIGRYNYTNIFASITIGNYFGVSLKNIKTAIESYIPNNNRSQLFKKNKIQIIFDAYNANPSSVREAILNLSQFKGFKVAILGDMFELGSIEDQAHREIVCLAKCKSINRIILVGYKFCKISIHNNNILQFYNKKKLIYYLINHPIKKGTILIKGSRKMALEELFNFLVKNI